MNLYLFFTLLVFYPYSSHCILLFLSCLLVCLFIFCCLSVRLILASSIGRVCWILSFGCIGCFFIFGLISNLSMLSCLISPGLCLFCHLCISYLTIQYVYPSNSQSFDLHQLKYLHLRYISLLADNLVINSSNFYLHCLDYSE